MCNKGGDGPHRHHAVPLQAAAEEAAEATADRSSDHHRQTSRGERHKPSPPPTANDDEKPLPKQPAIVTVRPKHDVPEMIPEEHQQRGDAADALWRELVRRATDKP
jgi:hypothetical protein